MTCVSPKDEGRLEYEYDTNAMGMQSNDRTYQDQFHVGDLPSVSFQGAPVSMFSPSGIPTSLQRYSINGRHSHKTTRHVLRLSSYEVIFITCTA